VGKRALTEHELREIEERARDANRTVVVLVALVAFIWAAVTFCVGAFVGVW